MAKRKRNILRLHVGTTTTDEFLGERLLLIPTSVSGWEIALGEGDARVLCSAVDQFAGGSAPNNTVPQSVAADRSALEEIKAVMETSHSDANKLYIIREIVGRGPSEQ